MRRALVTLGLVGLSAAVAVAGDYKEEDVQGGGAIVGVVTFDGTPPEPEMKDVPADKQGDCGAKALVEELIVDKASKGIKYAVVYIDKIDHGKKKPADPIKLDQGACVFQPHIVVAPVGSKVEFHNSDKASHNVNVKAVKNKGFNKQIAAGGTPVPWFAEAVENVQVVCDIHPWMKSYVVVKDHPYVAVTDEKGGFKIDGVPPGEYKVKVWHEKLGIQNKEGVAVKVEGGKDAKAEIVPLKPK